MSISYYEHNTDRFIKSTVNLDLTSIYKSFLDLLKEGACILDAGCGSGRDSKFFSDLGYRVAAFDASAMMVKSARQLTGLDIRIRRFEQVEEVCLYDGIWTCASLLHVPEHELKDVMNRLCNALKPDGIWYISFKYGLGERYKDGRHFTDMNEVTLNDLLSDLNNLSLYQLWITKDKRPERAEKWLNAILKKVNMS